MDGVIPLYGVAPGNKGKGLFHMGKEIMEEKPPWWDSLTCGEKLRAFDAPPSWR